MYAFYAKSLFEWRLITESSQDVWWDNDNGYVFKSLMKRYLNISNIPTINAKENTFNDCLHLYQFGSAYVRKSVMFKFYILIVITSISVTCNQVHVTCFPGIIDIYQTMIILRRLAAWNHEPPIWQNNHLNRTK